MHKPIVHSVITIVAVLAVLKFAKAGSFGTTVAGIANQIS